MDCCCLVSGILMVVSCKSQLAQTVLRCQRKALSWPHPVHQASCKLARDAWPKISAVMTKTGEQRRGVDCPMAAD